MMSPVRMIAVFLSLVVGAIASVNAGRAEVSSGSGSDAGHRPVRGDVGRFGGRGSGRGISPGDGHDV